MGPEALLREILNSQKTIMGSQPNSPSFVNYREEKIPLGVSTKTIMSVGYILYF